MKRIVLMSLGAAFASIVTSASPAPAHEPTCVETLGVEAHGQHVIGDYLVGGGVEWPPAGMVGPATAAEPAHEYQGGPGPGFHFDNNIAPGASFCTDAASDRAVEHNQVPWNEGE